jgi:hypothetical protein
MANEERPTTAFVLSLVGGVFILLGGGMMSTIGSFGFGGMMGFGGMGGMMGWTGFGLFGILGLIFGVIVVISAIMLNSKPQEHATWGTLIVLFSVLSIFGGAMGGFGVGLILGLIGGVLALTWKPTETQIKK